MAWVTALVGGRDDGEVIVVVLGVELQGASIGSHCGVCMGVCCGGVGSVERGVQQNNLDQVVLS